MMASFNSGIPSTAVYLVLPSWIALIAACLMLSGVSKSGSPAPRPITLRPAALSARALSVTAMVADGFTRSSAAARNGIIFSSCRRREAFGGHDCSFLGTWAPYSAGRCIARTDPHFLRILPWTGHQFTAISREHLFAQKHGICVTFFAFGLPNRQASAESPGPTQAAGLGGRRTSAHAFGYL